MLPAPLPHRVAQRLLDLNAQRQRAGAIERQQQAHVESGTSRAWTEVMSSDKKYQAACRSHGASFVVGKQHR